MKAKLIFDLNDTEDSNAHKQAINAKKMASILWEITHNLKKKCQSNPAVNEKDEGYTNGVHDGIDLVLEEISKLIQEEGIDIDELYR